MKLKTFFDNFGLMADAPNGVQKLREMVLQLAVQGKLVPQDPKDEPVSVLLEKIKAERERLIKEGKIKKYKPLPQIKSGEIHYDLPDSWEWVRLGDVANYGEGGKVSSNDIPEDAWLLDLADIEKDTSRIVQRVKFKDRISKSTKAEFQKGDVLYGKLRPYLNKVVVADDNGFCTTEIIPIRGYSGVFPKYLMYSLRSPRFLDYVDSKTYGTKMPRLGTEDANNSLFPLPPTNEQKRIVAKVDELMALCDELEARKQQVSINCIQLNEASVHKLLTAREPKKFSNHWQRICDNFDLLYSKPENVNKLRQAILQLAVQGKLVPQDPKEEPASVMLENIKAEKEIKKGKPLSPIDPDEIPHILPDSWEWVRVEDITDARHPISYGVLKPGEHDPNGIPLVKSQHINKLQIIGSIDFKITPELDAKYKRTKIKGGELLLNLVGASIGRCAIAPEWLKKANVSRAVAVITLVQNLNRRFFLYVLTNFFSLENISKLSSGSAQPVLNLSRIKHLILPLPPVSEQKRIVAKVDELMALCDELETNVSQSQTDCDKLMEAVAAEILAA